MCKASFLNLTFIFLDSHEKFSLVLLQITNFIYIPLKNVKKECDID